MRIFLVCVGAGDEAYKLAGRIIVDSGAQNYEDDFPWDGVQDPYRAVDEVDALVWLYRASHTKIQFSGIDYNPLYSDSVMQRAVRTKKPILYYEFKTDVYQPTPSILRFARCRHHGIASIPELERLLKKDIQDLLSGNLPTPQQSIDWLKVFLCHSKRDKVAVRELWTKLLQFGVQPWFDEENLVGGEDWNLAIKRAVRESHVILVLLSRRSVTTPGFAHTEIRLALDEADRQPEGSIFIIPVKLEDCQVPDRLQRWHWINLFEEKGFEKLAIALIRRAEDITTRENLFRES